MIRPNELEKLFDVIHPMYRPEAVIAGGYAVSPEDANDCDIWVIAADRTEMTKKYLRSYIKEHYPKADFRDNLDDQHYGEGHLVATINVDGLPIQVLVSEHISVQAMLDHFDISTHAIAVRPANAESMKVWCAARATTPHEEMRILRFTTPEQTWARMIKICDRYGIQVHPDDVVKLSEQFDVNSTLAAA